MQNLLSQNILFVKGYTPYNFIGMGQLAVEIKYTNGETDMLTTKSIKQNVHSSFEFNSEQEYFDFIQFLNSNNIKQLNR